MKKLSVFLILLSLGFMSCDDFLNPQQDLVVDESGLPNDERELLAMSLGLYAMQQDLVDQIFILGELRGDLLTVTENADPELRDINNFTMDKSNRYASPANFYKLIAACNKLIRIIEAKYPEVKDPESQIKNEHRMYGEVVTMRAWAYFYAVRIYNSVPYIPETLTSIEEIVAYVNAPEGPYVDSTFIDYSPFGIGYGYDNDTLGVDTSYVYTDTTTVYGVRNFLDQEFMTRQCLKDLNTKVRAVGVDYSIKDNINDDSWKVTVWNDNAMQAFKLQMYMHISAFDDAKYVLDNYLLNKKREGSFVQYALDNKFSGTRWQTIFMGHEENEHLFVLDFEKSASSWQQNSMQYYLSVIPPNIYAIKPTKKSVDLWECVWRSYSISVPYDNPDLAHIAESSTGRKYRGIPGDKYRGRGISFDYIKNGSPLTDDEYEEMIELRTLGYLDEVGEIMRGVDTVAYKYTFNSKPFDRDADFILYRAAALHLYGAELYANNRGLNEMNTADEFIYTGDPNVTEGIRMGVMGRVNLSSAKKGTALDNDYVYEFDPYSNEIIGYKSIKGVNNKIKYFDDVIMDNRGRELAYEGERFFDYIRIARRRNKAGNDGTEWLANSISEAFPAQDRAAIKERLMDEKNWYLPFVLKQ